VLAVVGDKVPAHYRATTGTTLADQSYWDLASLLDLLLDSDDPGDITSDDPRRFEDYAKTVLSHLL
jgi:hypothetical protein